MVTQTRYGLRRCGVVAGITGVLLLGAPGLTTAQRRSAERTLLFAPQDVGSSRIGLSIEDVAANDSADEGAVVRDVRRDSPAAAAGFVEGDLIVEFDGERVRSARQLTRLVRETPAGRIVGAIVVRDGSRVELEVTPESGAAVSLNAPALEYLGDRVRRFMPDARRDFTFDFLTIRAPVRLGVNVQELSPQLADYFGVDNGVLISSVDEESAAADAGLQAGDVITSVDGRAVDDSANLRRRLSGIDPGEEVSIGVTRAGRELELTATLGEDRARRRRLEIFRNDGWAI